MPVSPSDAATGPCRQRSTQRIQIGTHGAPTPVLGTIRRASLVRFTATKPGQRRAFYQLGCASRSAFSCNLQQRGLPTHDDGHRSGDVSKVTSSLELGGHGVLRPAGPCAATSGSQSLFKSGWVPPAPRPLRRKTRLNSAAPDGTVAANSAPYSSINQAELLQEEEQAELLQGKAQLRRQLSTQQQHREEVLGTNTEPESLAEVPEPAGVGQLGAAAGRAGPMAPLSSSGLSGQRTTVLDTPITPATATAATATTPTQNSHDTASNGNGGHRHANSNNTSNNGNNANGHVTDPQDGRQVDEDGSGGDALGVRQRTTARAPKASLGAGPATAAPPAAPFAYAATSSIPLLEQPSLETHEGPLQDNPRDMPRTQRLTAGGAGSTTVAAATAPPAAAPPPPPPSPGTSEGGFGFTAAELAATVSYAFDHDGCLPNVVTAAGLVSGLRTSVVAGLPGGAEDAAARREAFGVNSLPPVHEVSFWELVMEALDDFTVQALLVSGLLSLALAIVAPNSGDGAVVSAAVTAAVAGSQHHPAGGGGGGSTEWLEGAAILGTVALVVAVSAATGYAKESKFRQLNSLKDDVQVRVIRGGGPPTPVPSRELLVGDLVFVEAGDILQADGLLVGGGEIRLDQSHLTGESEDVGRTPVGMGGPPIVLSGSKVLDGYSKMLVLAVGPLSQQGSINAMMRRAGGGERGGGDAAAAAMRTAPALEQPPPPPLLQQQQRQRLPPQVGKEEGQPRQRQRRGRDLARMAAAAAASAAAVALATVNSVASYDGTEADVSGATAATEPPEDEEGQSAGTAAAAMGRASASAAATTAAEADMGVGVGVLGGDNGVGGVGAGGGAGASAALVSASPAALAAAGSSEGVDLRVETFLMQKLQVLAQQIGGVGVAAAAGVFLLNAAAYTTQLLAAAGAEAGELPAVMDIARSYLDLVITSITILVVAVPEGLPLAVTLALAFSVQRMLADNNLVRHLGACETMGAATTICSDKTGTLTTNDMTVVRLWAAGNQYRVRRLNRINHHNRHGLHHNRNHQHHQDPHQQQQQQQRHLTDPGQVPGSDPAQPHKPTAGQAPAVGSGEDSQDGDGGSGRPVAQLLMLQRRRGGAGASAQAPGCDRAAQIAESLGHPVAGAGAGAAAGEEEEVALAAGYEGKGKADVQGVTAVEVEVEASLPPHVKNLLVQGLVLNSTACLRTSPGNGGALERSGSPTECALLELPYSLGWGWAWGWGSGWNPVTAPPSGGPAAVAAAAAAGGEGAPAATAAATPSPPPYQQFFGGSGRILQLVPFSSQRKRMSVVVEVPPLEPLDQIGAAPAAAATPPPPGRSGGSYSLLQPTAGTGTRTGSSMSNLGTWSDSCDVGTTAHPAGSSSSSGSGSDSSSSSGGGGDGAGCFGGGSSSSTVTPVRVLTKGAAELVLERCAWQLGGPDGTAVLPLTSEQRSRLLASFSGGDAGSLRVLALAYRDMLVPLDRQPPPSAAAAAAAPMTAPPAAADDGSCAGAAAQAAALTGIVAGGAMAYGRGDGGTEGGVRPGASSQLTLDADFLERDLTLVGLVGLQDPLRPEVPAAVEACKRAGITVRMVTGDNITTAASIAQQAGILPPGMDVRALVTNSPAAAAAAVAAVSTSATADHRTAETAVSRTLPYLVLEGATFRQMVLRPPGGGGGGCDIDMASFLELWPRLRVLARCSPGDKYMVVSALRQLREEGRLEEVVAVTGDGTNDAPALTVADVGFCMNSGTPIAKEAADILLLDSSFTSIVSAVAWGRNVYSSVTRFLQFQLTANVVAVAVAVGGAVWLRYSPLSAVQMLWVNLIMDSLASLALATEAPNDAMLDAPPNRPNDPLVTPTVLKHVVGQAAFQLAVLYGMLLVFQYDGGSGAAAGDGLLGGALAALLTTSEAMGASGVVGGSGGDGQLLGGTLVFNAFVLMQLFNQLNCRRVRDEPNILEGLTSHPLFLAIVAGEAVLQYLIVQYGGEAFSTTPLTGPQWGLCVGLGATGLFVRAGLRSFRLQ